MKDVETKISMIINDQLDENIPETFQEDICLSCIADEAAENIVQALLFDKKIRDQIYLSCLRKKIEESPEYIKAKEKLREA